MATLNSTTYGTRTGQTFDSTNFPTLTNVNGWCTQADELIEMTAKAPLTNARSTNALTAIATLIVRRIQREQERIRYQTEKTGFTEPIEPLTRTIQFSINDCFQPAGLQVGSFKLVKDRTD